MLKYVTDNEYKSLMGTESIPSNFNKLVVEASSYINMETQNRVDLNNIPEEIKYVTCLIIDLINEAENKNAEMGNLKSQNIEGWQETYLDPKEIDTNLKIDKYNTLKTYLWNVVGTDGHLLLYRGMC